ncbi:hypothetical protein ESCAB7627_0973 [Escherichia albertii TW07627]|uniref:Uncharacterized protein n=1 Tax=Escherichia albertii (strain TW07627) TaxID=502347 RepID=A0ABC9NUZ0_ESCAT|nr:hypothetical protein ESCAB7627_0973 [Escherichia albertii TW07627]
MYSISGLQNQTPIFLNFSPAILKIRGAYHVEVAVLKLISVLIVTIFSCQHRVRTQVKKYVINTGVRPEIA